MEMQRLQTFRTVAALMNFNQAANILNCAQSTVSAQIKALENEIGTMLFKRIGKSVQLTEAGAKMLIYADKLLAIKDEALAEVRGNKPGSGMLTLRMPQTMATYYLPHILRSYQPRFPGIRLDITSCALHSLENELRIATVDLAFLFAESIGAKNLESEFLGSDPLFFVTYPGHPLSTRRRVDFKNLEGEVLLLPKSDCGYRMVLEQTLTAEKVTPATIIEMNSIEAIKQAIMAGLGVTVIPEIAVRSEIKEGRIARIAWVDDLETGILMIRYRDKWCPPPLDAFMDMVRGFFRAR
ncbi:LysR family transcriptional regulator [Syntrophobacter fumaroxidans]|uniref:Transcriptional regulator, LysR family n=1 Tax=Syntrophobacter fumaroxidans (strain DSM 10017 / MPOB) TaxID=335543 RepID=A0LGP0_SYNFM|nr:LysR family transcriptional regulator [Syntrophobacter fumaroxidans]ABK16592.1 transcriptional regulator, LysR family [Syntrophobacter fumaroxidans MPOB]